MKKEKLWMGVGLILILLLFGCGNAEADDMNQTKTGKEEILLWSYYETNEQQESLNKLVNDFNTSQDSYIARWEYVPMTEFTKRLAIGITEEELPDIVIIDNPDMYSYVVLGLFEDITDYLTEDNLLKDCYPQIVQSVMFDGRYYGVPFVCNNLALIYNKDIFEKSGVQPPKSWEEFYEVCGNVSGGDTYAFAMSAIEGEQCAFQVMPWILAQGEETDQLGGSGTEEAFLKIRSLLDEEYMDPNCINWSQNDVARKFIQGEAAMMENGPWVLPMLRESGVNYGIVSLPFGKECHSIVGGENIGVIKGKNVEGAMELIRYYGQDEVMVEICRQSNVLPPKQKFSQAISEGNPDMEIFSRQMDGAILRTSIKDWDKQVKGLSDALYKVVTKEKTPQQAAYELGQQKVE